MSGDRLQDHWSSGLLMCDNLEEFIKIDSQRGRSGAAGRARSKLSYLTAT